MKISATLAPALCLALAACDQSLSFVCPDSEQPAILLQVVDAGTQESVAAETTGWWTVGEVTDSLRHVRRTEAVTELAAYGPSGVYQIRVLRPGHAEWTRTNVVVAESACGPATVRLTAVPAPMNLADAGD
ncbi:MAG TPA: hypothetical protein VHG08_12910 [Longimicrobium sp.]|nr:hypothetical protein [Longimicrobium sp.]